MIKTNNKHFAKSVVGITLSFSILFSGGTLLTAKPVHAATVSASTTASNIISTGQRYLSVPYQWGAKSGRTDRFDCSSFTQYAFKLNGISIPRSSKQQSQVGTYVSRNQLQPGDLIFFYNPIHHVAIYMGNGKILHATNSSGVTITDLNSGYWNSHYNTAKRILPAFGQAVTAPNPVPEKSLAPTSNAPTFSAPTSSVPTSNAPRSSERSSNENHDGNHGENQHGHH
jgi:lipoprotein Spr